LNQSYNFIAYKFKLSSAIRSSFHLLFFAETFWSFFIQAVW